MYNWKACLFSTWAGQSLSKYVLSRRAATNSPAAYVVSIEAFSSAFSFTFHWISHVSVVTNSLMLGLRSQKSTLIFRHLKKASAKRKRKLLRMNWIQLWCLEQVLVNSPHTQTPEYWIYTSETMLYTQTKLALFWDFPLRVYNHIPWWEKLQTST